MSEKKLREALSDYAGALTVMSFSAGQSQSISILTPEQQRDRCALKFAAVKVNWNKDFAVLAELEKLTSESIAAFAAGEIDKGHFLVKEIDRILWELRG